MQVDVILLAGGASRRFASRSGPAQRQKLLAPWQGAPLFHRAFQTVSLLPPGCRALVVTREPEIAAQARRCAIEPVPAPPPDEGIAASVRAGTSAARSGASLCFFVCDQPRFPPELFRDFLSGYAASGKGLGRAVAGQRMGSPTAFSPKYRRELLALRGDEGGRSIFPGREQDTFYFQVPSCCLEDLDLPWDPCTQDV